MRLRPFVSLALPFVSPQFPNLLPTTTMKRPEGGGRAREGGGNQLPTGNPQRFPCLLTELQTTLLRCSHECEVLQ